MTAPGRAVKEAGAKWQPPVLLADNEAEELANVALAAAKRETLALNPYELRSIISAVRERLRKQANSDRKRVERGDLPEWWDPEKSNRRNRELLARLEAELAREAT